MASCWMKIYRTYPWFMTLPCHYIFIIFKVPNFPCAIITSCSYYLFFCVQCHSSNSFRMRINFLLNWHSLIKILKSLRKIWIWSGILRPLRIASFQYSCLFNSSSHSLFFHASIDLFLNFLFMFLYFFLDFIHSFL